VGERRIESKKNRQPHGVYPLANQFVLGVVLSSQEKSSPNCAAKFCDFFIISFMGYGVRIFIGSGCRAFVQLVVPVHPSLQRGLSDSLRLPSGERRTDFQKKPPAPHRWYSDVAHNHCILILMTIYVNLYCAAFAVCKDIGLAMGESYVSIRARCSSVNPEPKHIPSDLLVPGSRLTGVFISNICHMTNKRRNN